MNVTQDLSILSLVTNASVPVQLVMALLLAVSFMSWLFIFRKLFAIRQARTQTEKFERDFWSGGDLERPVPERGQRPPSHRRAGAHLRGRLPRIHQAARAARRSTRASRWTARAAPCAPPISAKSTIWSAPVLSRLGRFGQPLRRPVRHGVGHHEFVPRPGQRQPGDAGARRARASPRRWSPPPSACSPRFRRWSPTTATPTTSTASRSASRASWRSFPTSCSASPARANREASDAAPAPRHERDQRRALHRRDAGAAGDLHGHRAAGESGRGRPALAWASRRSRPSCRWRW